LLVCSQGRIPSQGPSSPSSSASSSIFISSLPSFSSNTPSWNQWPQGIFITTSPSWNSFMQMMHDSSSRHAVCVPSPRPNTSLGSAATADALALGLPFFSTPMRPKTPSSRPIMAASSSPPPPRLVLVLSPTTCWDRKVSASTPLRSPAGSEEVCSVRGSADMEGCSRESPQKRPASTGQGRRVRSVTQAPHRSNSQSAHRIIRSSGRDWPKHTEQVLWYPFSTHTAGWPAGQVTTGRSSSPFSASREGVTKRDASKPASSRSVNTWVASLSVARRKKEHCPAFFSDALVCARKSCRPTHPRSDQLKVPGELSTSSSSCSSSSRQSWRRSLPPRMIRHRELAISRLNH
jgi:hypothetical protein